MASWRWLLVLWQLSWFQMGDSGFTSFKTSNQPGWKQVTVPADGIYIVSVSAYPCYHCGSNLYASLTIKSRYGFGTIFNVDGYFIVSHTEVAMALRRNNLLTLSVRGSMQGPSSLSIAYVSGLDGSYTTVFTTSSSAVPHFNKELLDTSWRLLRGNQGTSFSVPTSGMYWVTAKVVPLYLTTSLSVTNEQGTFTSHLFTVTSQEKLSVSCSGAFRLRAGSVVKAKNLHSSAISRDAVLSFVYLKGNRRPHTGSAEHIAFTGILGSVQRRRYNQIITFPSHLTNYGYLYGRNGQVTIRTSGSYMICLRADPRKDVSIILDLVVNGNVKWSSSSEDGVSSGQTIPLVLKSGDTLKVVTHATGVLEADSLFSIAFLNN